jgi:hypothetical protein
MHSDNRSSTAFVPKTLESSTGAILCSGRGLASVQAHVQRSFEEARALGPTIKGIRQVAADFVQEVQSQNLGDGLEIIEEKKPAIPLKPLVDRAAPILERLARMPMLRKRPTNVWTVEEVPDAPETLFEAALVSLGHKSADSVSESRPHISIVSIVSEPNKRRSWWKR